MATDDFSDLPPDLPRPEDDGACTHLTGLAIPHIALRSTGGGTVDVGALGRAVVFVFPRTGGPMWTPPAEWDGIPGARGCTPESLGFRARYADFVANGWEVYGLSSQSPQEQRETRDRLDLPFPLLSDVRLQLADALSLPTFEVGGKRLLKRVTLVVVDGGIRRHFYPVFPPDGHAIEVLATLGAAP